MLKSKPKPNDAQLAGRAEARRLKEAAEAARRAAVHTAPDARYAARKARKR